MAKRGSDRRESGFDPEELDMRREREYLNQHPAPREDVYYANIATVRSEAEIEYRKRLVRTLSKPEYPKEQLDFSKVQFHTFDFGFIFSNILLSYIVHKKVKIPEIDFKVYYQIANKPFLLHMKEKDGTDKSQEFVNTNKFTLGRFVRKWLEQTQFKDYIDAYALKYSKVESVSAEAGDRTESDEAGDRTESDEAGDGTESDEAGDGTDSYEAGDGADRGVEIDPAVLMTRRCAILNVQFICDGEMTGHQLFMFWQLHEHNGDFVIEYGICDNMRIQEDYQPTLNINFDFHDVIQNAFVDYLRDSGVRNRNVQFVFIHNLLPCMRYDQLHYKKMGYNCAPMTRRAILYFAIFYDIFRLNCNKDMERKVRHDLDHDSAALTRKELLYIKNFKFFTHYMNRMFEWVLSSPLLWPRYDPSLPDDAQEMPTMARPLFIVLFSCGFVKSGPREYVKRAGPDRNLWIELNNDTTHIRLFDLFTGMTRKYYLHIDDGEVFRQQGSEYGGSGYGGSGYGGSGYGGGTCDVSAAADFQELSCVLSALHQRLEALELTRL